MFTASAPEAVIPPLIEDGIVLDELHFPPLDQKHFPPEHDDDDESRRLDSRCSVTSDEYTPDRQVEHWSQSTGGNCCPGAKNCFPGAKKLSWSQETLVERPKRRNSPLSMEQ